MAKKKNGFFTRLVEGPERSEDYARKTLPTSRWSLGWDLLTTNFGKLVKINLLTFLFVFPVFALLIFRTMLIEAQSANSSFSQNMGIGYPAVHPNIILGTAEQIDLNSNMIFFLILIVLSFYVSIGLAGGFYVLRNMVWTEGVFVASDFWSGVKKNYKNTLLSTLLFVFIAGLTILTINLCDVQIVIQSNLSWLFTIIKIFDYIALALFVCVYLYTLTVGVTYKLSLFGIIRNSLILGVGLLPINAFFIILGLAPFALLLFDVSNILFTLGAALIIFISLSIFMLVWTNYSQWTFDEFVNDFVPGAKKYRGIYKKNVESDKPEDFVYRKNTLSSRAVKPITDDDVVIETLPESYSRKDLERLLESKRKMIEDSDRYALEHSVDESAESAIDEFMSDSEPAKTETSVSKKQKPVKYKKKGK
ncbi:MAG: hypothetical protein IKL82_06040 [Clostridia bacterium]|nr:hypothetical protein [Clostridia bacterium]